MGVRHRAVGEVFRGRLAFRSRRHAPRGRRFEPLEHRLALTGNYVDFEFSNQSDALADTDVWLWVTGQTSTASTAPTLAFEVNTATGIATPITNPATTAVPLLKLSDLGGRPIRFDASTTIVGGRIYFTTSPYSPVADATTSAVTTSGSAMVPVQGISTGQVSAGNLKPGSLVTGTGIPVGTTVTTVNSQATPIQTTASFAAGVNSFTVESTTGLSANMLVTGPGLANLTTVQTVDAGTSTITLAPGVLTQSAQSSQTLKFSQSSVGLSNAATASTGVNGSGVPNSTTLSFFLPAITIGLVNGVVQVTGGSAAATASYVYDFAEFAITPNSPQSTYTLTVDTSQVDQFGLPFRLQTTPADAINPAGSGTISTASRAAIFADFTAAMTLAGFTPFLDCVKPGLSAGSPPLRLLAPQDVISQQAAAAKPIQTPVLSVTTGGTQGAWTAQLSVPANTAGQLLNSGGQLAGTFYAFGSLLPAGTLVTAAVASANPNDTITVQTASQATTNPFSTAAGQFVTIYTPPPTELNTWFGPAVNSTTNVNVGNPIDEFFAYWKNPPSGRQLRLEVTGQNGTATIYTGTVTTIQQTSTGDTTATYTVLQMANTSTGESYNIFYPYFTTNSPATKTDPFGNPVPAPPTWMFSGSYLGGGNESPSQMVFAADGVFANSATAPQGAPPSGAYTGISSALGSLENQIVTALARGYATTWQTVENAVPGTVSLDGKTVTWQLPAGTLSGAQPTATLSVGMNVSSWKIFSVPMEITAVNAAADQVTVWTPATFTGSTPVTDMLLFFDMYPAGQRWSGYAKYLHNLMGYDVMIGGRAYALPYDDNGGFSTTLSSVYDPATPLTTGGTTAARTTVTLGNWTTRPAVDLNGDGIGDAIWHDQSAGDFVGWIYDAQGNVTSQRYLGGAGGWTLEAAGYFDADPVSDLVWRDTVSGSTVLWILNSGGGTSVDIVLGGSPDFGIEATGDYNGDGFADIVWRQDSTGAHVMWLLVAGAPIQTGVVLVGNASWQLVPTAATYDANGDGLTDLVWNNTAAGDHVVFVMNGVQQLANFALVTPAGATLAATGFFDADGIGDLIWHWPATGQTTPGRTDQWLMSYSSPTATGSPSLPSTIRTDPNQDPLETASFWGDELVWRNRTTGINIVWRLIGADAPQPSKRVLGGNSTWRLLGRAMSG